MIYAILFGTLWRAGGVGELPWGAKFRKVGAPLCLYLITHNWIASGLLFLATIVPITLIGDDLTKKGLLWWWIPILSLMCSAPLIYLGHYWAIPLAVIQWLSIVGSNTINFPKWHWYEFFYGFLFGLCLYY